MICSRARLDVIHGSEAVLLSGRLGDALDRVEMRMAPMCMLQWIEPTCDLKFQTEHKQKI
jgi:hypothetical protein